ncbi:MAG: hypothetical protein ACRCZ2_09550 [Fusobacteriaceae bacterium]
MIPFVSNGDSLKTVRENVLNVIVDKVNKSTLNVVEVGGRCTVDHRVFNFTTTESTVTLSVDLESDEFPVRGVSRNFDATAKKGEFLPLGNLKYDRTLKKLTVPSNGVKSGQLFIEFWKYLQ